MVGFMDVDLTNGIMLRLYKQKEFVKRNWQVNTKDENLLPDALGTEIAKLHTEGKKPSVIAKELNIGVASVYRYRHTAGK